MRQRRSVPLMFAIVTCTLVLSTNRAHADDLLDYVIQAVAPDLPKETRPLIECLAGGGSATACAEEAAKSGASGALDKLSANDNRIQLAVKVFEAARDDRWLDVIASGGQVVAKTLACAVLPLAGPLKTAACGVVGWVISNQAKTLNDVYQALKGPDWWALVKIISVETVCKFIPADGAAAAARDFLCSGLGQILVAAQQFAEAFGNAVVAGADAVENLLFGSDEHMSYDKYYGLYWQPWYHRGVDSMLQGQTLGFVGGVYNTCVEYFDSHNQYKSTAEKTCGDMRDKRFLPQVKAFTAAMGPAVTGYFEAVAKPAIRTAARVTYGKPSTGGDIPGRQFFLSNCAFQMKVRFPYPDPNEAACDALKLYADSGTLVGALISNMVGKCYATVKSQTLSPTAWVHACDEMSTKYGQQFVIESGKIVISIKELEAKGCTATKGQELATKGLRITCPTYASHSECLTDFAPDGKKYCAVNVPKLDKPKGTESNLKATKPVLAGVVNLEAEDVLAKSKLTHKGGEVTAQDTAGFGTGWSGDKQILWTAGAVGDSLELTLDVATAGTYAVEVYLAHAPDYGRLKIEIDGKPAVPSYDGFSPKVMPPTPTQAGKASLDAGEHTLRFEIIGNYRGAKGYFVGLDRVRLYWTGNVSSSTTERRAP